MFRHSVVGLDLRHVLEDKAVPARSTSAQFDQSPSGRRFLPFDIEPSVVRMNLYVNGAAPAGEGVGEREVFTDRVVVEQSRDDNPTMLFEPFLVRAEHVATADDSPATSSLNVTVLRGVGETTALVERVDKKAAAACACLDLTRGDEFRAMGCHGRALNLRRRAGRLGGGWNCGFHLPGGAIGPECARSQEDGEDASGNEKGAELECQHAVQDLFRQAGDCCG